MSDPRGGQPPGTTGSGSGSQETGPGSGGPESTTSNPATPDQGGSGGPETALPPVWARVLAFVSVLLGGACGGFIGYAFGTLGGFSDIATGVIAMVVGLGLAGGVAVVAVLTLRALGEWETIRAQGPEAVRAARAARAARGKS